MKQLMRFLLITIVLSAMGFLDAYGDIPITRMKASTVRVFCVKQDEAGTGSGFVIGNGAYVVTNWHVLACVDDGGDPLIALNHTDMIKAQVFWKSEDKDLAILKLDRQVSRPSVKFATRDQVQDAETVYALGFPAEAGREDIVDEQSGYEVKVTKGIISAFVTGQSGTAHYQIDAAINPGNSGGPLFNQQGHVIGINDAKALVFVEVVRPNAAGVPEKQLERLSSGEGIGWAIQADELLPELNRLGIAYQQAGAIDQFLVYLTPQTILTTIAVLIALASLYTAASQSRRTAVARTVTRFGETIGIRSKRPVGQPGTPSVSAPSVSSRTTAVLIGMGGAFSGSEFPLNDDAVILGRDPKQASIVFPEQQREISRGHARIFYDRTLRTFVLEDLHSARGTFLDSGKKLIPGQPVHLRTGERFYVVSRKHTFQVLEKEI